MPMLKESNQKRQIIAGLALLVALLLPEPIPNVRDSAFELYSGQRVRVC
jgi:hypothetical protein